jgi:hypothetical protein
MEVTGLIIGVVAAVECRIADDGDNLVRFGILLSQRQRGR